MKVKHICNLSNTNLSKSKLWEQDIEEITPIQIITYIELESLKGTQLGVKARDDINFILSEAGALNCASKISYMLVPDRRYTLDELDIVLSLMSVNRRSAVLYSLETKTNITDTETLKWKDTIRLKFSPMVKSMLNNLPRHIGTDFVFWEQIGKIVMPVMGTRVFLKEHLGLDWEWLQYAYNNMDFVRIETDYKELKRHVIGETLI